MDLFEFENERFGKDLWTKEAIEECRESKPNKDSGTPINNKPDEYYCWYGTRIPCWFE